jgi:hypothetical protein
MNQPNTPIRAELIEAVVLPSGHCAVKLLVRDCDGIRIGDALDVIEYEVKGED